MHKMVMGQLTDMQNLLWSLFILCLFKCWTIEEKVFLLTSH